VKARWILLLAATPLVLVAIALIALRLALGAVVRSDGMREALEHYGERALRVLVPHPMMTLRDVDMDGVANVTITEVVVRNQRRPQASVAFTEVRVRPELLSLVTPGPTTLDVSARTGATGTVHVTAKVPLGAVWRVLRARSAAAAKSDGASGAGDASEAAPAPAEEAAVATAEGSFDALEAKAFGGLYFGGEGPALELTGGTLRGAFSFTQGVAVKAGGKNGHLSARVIGPQWELVPTSEAAPASETRKITVEDFGVELELAGGELRTREAVTLVDAKGRATIAGALLMPTQAEPRAAWDVTVDSDGGTDLPTSLGRIFRCKVAPRHMRFTVRGPIVATTCRGDPTSAQMPGETPAAPAKPQEPPTTLPQHPLASPSAAPAPEASAVPVTTPAPTSRPSATPAPKTTPHPSAKPAAKPGAKPTHKPTAKPTTKPKAKPTAKPKPHAKPAKPKPAKPPKSSKGAKPGKAAKPPSTIKEEDLGSGAD
jgi:hypothetical protein